MYDEDYNIKTLEDVQNFAKYLYYERGVAFHPDDDFADYENIETHEPTFNTAEAKLFNRLMEQCFDVIIFVVHNEHISKNKLQCSPSEPTKAHITTKEFVIYRLRYGR